MPACCHRRRPDKYRHRGRRAGARWARNTCACVVLHRRSVSLNCTSSYYTTYPDRWKEKHGGIWTGQEGGAGADQPRVQQSRGSLSDCCLSLLRARFFNVESSPEFHVISQAAAAPTAGARTPTRPVDVHEFSGAISAPVSFKGWRLVTLADGRLRMWRLHWSRSALPPPNSFLHTGLCCIVPTGKVRLRRGSPCRFVCWSDESVGRCYLGLTVRMNRLTIPPT